MDEGASRQIFVTQLSKDAAVSDIQSRAHRYAILSFIHRIIDDESEGETSCLTTATDLPSFERLRLLKHRKQARIYCYYTDRYMKPNTEISISVGSTKRQNIIKVIFVQYKIFSLVYWIIVLFSYVLFKRSLTQSCFHNRLPSESAPFIYRSAPRPRKLQLCMLQVFVYVSKNWNDKTS